MVSPTEAIPFIDIFAGPGGLSEGFTRFGTFAGCVSRFEGRLSIEKDPVAARTLTLRSFFRGLAEGGVLETYYDVIRGKSTLESLAIYPEWERARGEVWNAELGVEPAGLVDARIHQAIGDRRDWVLLGGPPCQAYSLMGRARMTGVGFEAREAGQALDALKQVKRDAFAKDHRHLLYREYLRIVAKHRPAVFVMENVKGILSSRLVENGLDTGRVFDRIRRDLSDPQRALGLDTGCDALRYRLYALAIGGTRVDDELSNHEFVVRSELYGIPQRRHRVIVLGVRDDLAHAPAALVPASEKTTVRDAIGTMPHLESGVSRRGSEKRQGHVPSERVPFRGGPFVPHVHKARQNPLDRWLIDARLGGAIQHASRAHMASDLERYQYAAEQANTLGSTPKLEDWPVELLPQHRNAQIACAALERGKIEFNDRFRVQLWHEPASTVTSHISKDGHYYIHPDAKQCRSLTVREAARLQTFPDNYFFCGNRTQQYHQVGNAVPPLLACQIAAIVARILRVEYQQ